MTVSEPQQSMPTNAYAVLGLISFGESSGYDLKRLADHSIHFFYWSPAPSQVYSELRRLESLGYVTERRVQQETRPDKRLYHITPSGRDELQRWLDESEVVPDVLKSVFLLKLFFGGDTSPEVLIGQLEARFNQMEERLLQYEEIENEINDQGDWLFPYLTLGYGMAHVRAEIEWICSAIDLLRESSAGPLS